MSTAIREKKVTCMTGSLVTVQLIITVSLSGVLIVMCYFWKHGQNSDIKSDSRKQYCIPCQNISLNVDEDSENFRNMSFQQGEYKRCCAVQDMIPKYVELIIERYRRKQISSGFISEVPQSCAVLDHQTVTQGSAKVVGFPDSVLGYSVNNSYVTILYWDENSSRSFIGSDVEYRNGSLVIGRSRLLHCVQSGYVQPKPPERWRR